MNHLFPTMTQHVLLVFLKFSFTPPQVDLLKKLFAGIDVRAFLLCEAHEALYGRQILPLHLVIHDVRHLRA